MYKEYLKKIIEFLLSIILLITLSPLIIILSLFLLLLNGRPIFFIQKRFGLHNNYFYIYKFRTLIKDTKDIPTNEVVNYKYAKLGKFLRRTNIDELPQLVNILRGEMSLIGPRPALYNQINLKNLREKYLIHELRPGITGYAQIHGFENMSDEEKIKFDLYYLNNLSIILDLKIIISTFKFFFKKAPKH
tara:strand:- start:99 stop:665 length:567 start_codon:yes stop_codon:yes gene_type:complete